MMMMMMQPMMYVTSIINHAWSSVMSFGTLMPDWNDFEEGLIWGVFHSGPWIGLKSRDSPLRSLFWVGAGKGEGFNHHVWRHTCFVLNSRYKVLFALFQNPGK